MLAVAWLCQLQPPGSGALSTSLGYVEFRQRNVALGKRLERTYSRRRILRNVEKRVKGCEEVVDIRDSSCH